MLFSFDNIIIKIVSYLTVQLNRIFDYLFLIIKKHCHDELIKDKVIDDIRTKLLTMKFDEGKEMFEISEAMKERRKRLNNQILVFTKAQERIEELRKYNL